MEEGLFEVHGKCMMGIFFLLSLLMVGSFFYFCSFFHWEGMYKDLRKEVGSLACICHLHTKSCGLGFIFSLFFS